MRAPSAFASSDTVLHDEPMPSKPLELPIVEVSGSPRELGRGQGEAFRAKVNDFVAMRLDAVRAYFAERGQGGWERLLEVGREGFSIYEQWDPEGFAEHCGLAEGAGIDAARLFTVANMTDLRDAVLLAAERGAPLKKNAVSEGCSSVLVPGGSTANGQPLVGQTWDLNPPDVDYVIGVHRRPTSGPETWAVTCTGCLTLVGMNAHGLAVGTTNIKTYGSKPGVGYLSILHRAVRAKDVDEAMALVKGAPHAGAHTYWLADAAQQVEWESSPNASFLRDTREGPIWRTNHCLSPLHRELEGEEPSESSRKRFETIGAQVGKGGLDLSGLKAVFADRSQGILSVNRYPEDGQGTATNAVFIASPSEKRAWACRGPADRGAWVELRFG